MKMTFQQHNAKPSKTRRHGKESEGSDYRLSHSHSWMESDSQNVPKNDSRDQPKNSLSHRHHGDSSMNNGHGISPEPLSSQYNDFQSSLPPSPSPPPNPYPYPHPHLPYSTSDTRTRTLSTSTALATADFGGSVVVVEGEEEEREREEENETDQVQEEVTTMFIPAEMQLDSRKVKILQSADRLPPVRASSLCELDLNHIMRNINLRVDVNFDRDLHFRPVDGVKGREKRLLAERYWEAIAIEISVFSFSAMNNNHLMQSSLTHHYQDCNRKKDHDGDEDLEQVEEEFEPRLPAMLESLRDVVSSLVPERDQQAIMQNLDVPFLMQQVEKGVLDLINLTEWLSTLLKMHCAPMRDSWADQMVSEIGEGCENQDTYKMVQGLRTMFGILEAMKLDVANHQIRAFRVILIDDSIRFLQSYFKKRVPLNSVNVARAKKWYHDIRHQRNRFSPHLQQELMASFEPIAALFTGLFSLLIPFDSPKGFPATFEFDTERLWHLRADIQDLMGLEICTHVFELMLIRYNRHISYLQQAKADLQSRICSILDDGDNNIIVEGDNSHRHSQNSSGVSSNDNRWKNNMSRIALELAQTICTVDGSSSTSTRYPDDHTLLFVEKSLQSFFTSPVQQFREFRFRIQKKLEIGTFDNAKQYLRMTPLEMCEDQRPRQIQDNKHHNSACNGSSNIPLQSPYVEMGSITKRLAHIGVLHWRVWAPMLYIGEVNSALGSAGTNAMRPMGQPRPSTATGAGADTSTAL